MTAAAAVLLPTWDDLDSIVGDVVYTLDDLPHAEGAAAAGDDRAVRGAVDIIGDEACTVEVQLSLAAAAVLAQAMFGLTPDETSDADVLDAVGELANIVAGNTKSLADSDLVLGLPRTGVVATASDPSATSSLIEVTQPWRGHDLRVTVHPPTTGDPS